MRARRPLHLEPGRTVRRQPPRRARREPAAQRAQPRRGGAGRLLRRARAAQDDVTAPASPADGAPRDRPRCRQGARSGPVALVDLGGQALAALGRPARRGPAAAARHATAPPGCPRRSRPRSREPRTLFYGGPQRAVFTYRALGSSPMDLQVNLVRVTDNAVVRSWDQPAVAPGALNRVRWTGAVKGRVPRVGKLRLRALAPAAPPRPACAPPRPSRPDAITVYDHMFPVRGAHDFGDAARPLRRRPRGPLAPGPGRLRRLRHAAGRGARRQGQVLRLPLRRRLLRRDRRQGHRRRQRLHAPARARRRAGRRPRLHRPGDRRRSATPATRVGCHLHFEEWTAPGWYDGGHPVDPLPDLKRWDRTS